MLTSYQKKQSLKQTFKEISQQIWDLRYQKKLSLPELAVLSRIPQFWLEAMECPFHNINIGYLCQLAAFYDKRIKIELVAPDNEKKSKE